MRHPFIALCLAATLAPTLAHAGGDPLERVERRSFSALRADLKASLGKDGWAALKREAVKLQPIRGRWLGEDKPGFVKDGSEREPVTYLRSEAERAPYRVKIGTDGRFYDKGGKPLDTDGELVVMVMNGEEVYAPVNRHDTHQKNLKHSSFTAGEPVEMPFEGRFENGVPVRFKNRSGHYRPSRRDFVKWLLKLESRGVRLDRLDVEFDPKSS